MFHSRANHDSFTSKTNDKICDMFIKTDLLEYSITSYYQQDGNPGY